MKKVVLLISLIMNSLLSANPIVDYSSFFVETVIANGTTIISANDNIDIATFEYYVSLLIGNGVSFRTATITGTALQTGTFEFDYTYSGNHAWTQATVFFQVQSSVETKTILNNQSVSGDFSLIGSDSIAVEAGQQISFIIGGENDDSSNWLTGGLTITETSAPANWTKITGNRAIDIGADSEVWIVNNSYWAYRWLGGNNWEQHVPALNISDGWLVKDTGAIYQWSGSGTQWNNITGKSATDIGAGNGEVWIVSDEPYPSPEYGYWVYRWLGGSNWEQHVPASAISADRLVTGTGEIYQWSGFGTQWNNITGKSATDIGAGNGEVWIVSDEPVSGGFKVYYWNGGSTWQDMNLGAVRIDVDQYGNAWAVDNLGIIYRRYSPTVIELISFTVEHKTDYVLLAWSTASEKDNAGFHIWRKAKNGGEYTRITTHIIPSQGDSISGAEYSYRDADTIPDETYYYKLEDIDTSGKSTFHGPVATD